MVSPDFGKPPYLLSTSSLAEHYQRTTPGLGFRVLGLGYYCRCSLSCMILDVHTRATEGAYLSDIPTWASNNGTHLNALCVGVTLTSLHNIYNCKVGFVCLVLPKQLPRIYCHKSLGKTAHSLTKTSCQTLLLAFYL